MTHIPDLGDLIAGLANPTARHACGHCGQPALRAWEIDGAGRLINPTPTADGHLVLIGDPDRPTALWDVPPAGETLPWGTVVPAGAPRYDLHECDDR